MQRRTILSTDRLVVTTWLPGDIEDLHRLHSDALTMRFVREGRPETRNESQDLLAEYVREQATRGWTKWRLADHNGDFVGRAGFGPRGHDRELGYTIRRDLWGSGLATEVAAALVRWHLDHACGDPPAQLWAYAAVENIPSRRVLEKLGFSFAGCSEHNDLPCALYQLPGRAAARPVLPLSARGHADVPTVWPAP